MRKSITMDDELYLELVAYAADVDRTFQNFLIHAARQYMRRYPRDGPKPPRRASVVSEDVDQGEDAVRLQDCSPQGTAEGGRGDAGSVDEK